MRISGAVIAALSVVPTSTPTGPTVRANAMLRPRLTVVAMAAMTTTELALPKPTIVLLSEVVSREIYNAAHDSCVKIAASVGTWSPSHSSSSGSGVTMSTVMRGPQSIIDSLVIRNETFLSCSNCCAPDRNDVVGVTASVDAEMRAFAPAWRLFDTSSVPTELNPEIDPRMNLSIVRFTTPSGRSKPTDRVSVVSSLKAAVVGSNTIGLRIRTRMQS